VAALGGVEPPLQGDGESEDVMSCIVSQSIAGYAGLAGPPTAARRASQVYLLEPTS
jgi:hypothetical protein